LTERASRQVTRTPIPTLNTAAFLTEHRRVFLERALPGPVLDLACGGGHNGVFLAREGVSVVCCDRSPEALKRTRALADEHQVNVGLWQADLEREGVNPLPVDFYGGILVFRYLHRPLIPQLRKSLKAGGVLMYETFTVEQPRFGKPKNPDFLLNQGELREWFEDWEVIDFFEGIRTEPERAVAQIVCRKPG
jgi:SAM-dependent methyltransferase